MSIGGEPGLLWQPDKHFRDAGAGTLDWWSTTSDPATATDDSRVTGKTTRCCRRVLTSASWIPRLGRHRRTISENDIMAMDLFGYSIGAPAPVRPPNDNFVNANGSTEYSGTLTGTNCLVELESRRTQSRRLSWRQISLVFMGVTRQRSDNHRHHRQQLRYDARGLLRRHAVKQLSHVALERRHRQRSKQCQSSSVQCSGRRKLLDCR